MSQNARNEDTSRNNEKLPLIGGSHSEVTSNPTACSWTVLKAIYCAAVACLGGLSFGLTVVFSSPLLDDLMRSNLTQWKEGFSTEQCAYQILIGPISPIAAIVGGLLSAPLTAISGLVSGMILTAGVYLSGWTMVGSTYFITSPFAFRGLLLTGRALTGFAMGFSAASAPVYNAEISPANIRGMLGGFFQMSVVIGVFISYLTGGLLCYWKASFIFAGISICHFALLFTIRESPKRSRNPFKNLRQLTHRTPEGDHIPDQQHSNATSESDSTSKFNFFWRLALVVLIMVFQQVTGVNAISFYAGPILKTTGLKESGVITADMAASLSIGVVQLIPTFISIFLVDRFGRRLLLFFGSIALAFANLGMVVYFALSYGLVPSSQPNAPTNNLTANSTSSSSCFNNDLAGSETATRLKVMPLVSIGVYFVAFSLSWGPIAWTFAAEILPDKIRMLGNGMGAATNWICVSAVTLLFPIFAKAVGYAIPFLVFAVLAIVSAIFVVLFIPETRGLTLQESSALKFSVTRNIKEFVGLLKWCFCCQCCRRTTTRPCSTSAHVN